MQYFENIYPKEIDYYLLLDNVIIVDLRSDEEYNKSHIKGAINIPYENIKKNINTIPKKMLVLLYCSTGVRSIQVARILAAKGYLVKNVIGGIKKYYGSSLT